MEQLVTSRKNPQLQLIRKLIRSRAERRKQGLYVADGTKLLEEALKWAPPELIVLAEGVEVASIPEVCRVLRVPMDVMESISPMETPQGAVFVGKIPPMEDFTPQPGSLILDGIQDPGNLGTILRTADALEVPVILGDGCADPYNPKTIRASMGAVFRTPPVSAAQEDILGAFSERKIPIYAAALTEQAVDLRQVALHKSAAVIGSEGQGVNPDFLARCHGQIIIPMNSRCESLNAAVAATIVMWQMKI